MNGSGRFPKETQMGNAFFVPILPGKTEAAYAFANDLSTTRRSDMDKSQIAVTKESWFIQETPQGNFIIVYYHAPDADKVFENLAASTEPFDVWFKQQVLEITGVDCNEPTPPAPKQVLSWSR